MPESSHLARTALRSLIRRMTPAVVSAFAGTILNPMHFRGKGTCSRRRIGAGDYLEAIGCSPGRERSEFWAITMGTRRLVAVFGAALAISLTLPAAGAGSAPFDDPATALRDYVAAEDPAYGYRVDSSSSGDGYTVHLLRMTSQRWRAPGEALPTRWRHWLVVIVPDEVSEGSWRRHGDRRRLRRSGAASFDDDEIRFGAQLAVLSETVVAILMQAPYQPITFPDADAPLKEDALVAYSWDKAIETGDYSWAVHLPMVKAAVRAMDTVQDFVPGVAPAALERFVVIGASKRGAAAWLTAVVDPRVAAIAPMVIDVLNFSEQMAHHLAVYGDYAPALERLRRVRGWCSGSIPEGAALGG